MIAVLFFLFFSIDRLTAGVHSKPETVTPPTLEKKIANSMDGAIELEYSFWKAPSTMLQAFRFRIVNRSSASRTVRITLQDSYSPWKKPYYSKTIHIPGGRTVLEHAYPPFICSQSGSTAYADFDSGERIQLAAISRDNGSFASRSSTLEKMAALEPVATEDLDLWEARDLAGIPLIRIRPAFWENLSGNRKRFLLEWVVRGGTLQITAPPSFAENLRKTWPPPMDFDESGERYGAGAILSREDFQKNPSAGFPESNVFFRCLDEWNGKNREPIYWEMSTLRPAYFVPLLILAGILGGPGVFLWCRRKNRPALALLLIPAISLLSCLLLLFFALFRDGIHPKVLFRSMTCLDQRSSRYRVYSFTGLEAPLGLVEDLEFAEDSIVVFFRRENVRTEVEGGKLRLDGMVRPRIPLFFSVVRDAAGRGRIEVLEETDVVPAAGSAASESVSSSPRRIRIINGLGTDLKSFVLRDRSGAYWRAGSSSSPVVQAGGEMLLSPCSSPPGELYGAMENLYYGDNQLFYPGPIPPGSWQAELQENVFAEFPLRHCVFKEGSRHFVTARY